MTELTDTGTADTPDARSNADAAPPSRLGPSFHKLFGASVVSNLGDGMATVAYPWLASAITRNPVLIALIIVAQRLPWLVFTLPAGVITDRVDRRRAMVAMDTLRGALTLVVALAVLGAQGDLPGPDAADAADGTRTGLYLIVLFSTLLLGMAEVLRDNSAQTLMPNLVHPDQLERANGRLWSAEGVMNTFVGPPLGSLLLVAAFAVPFFVDAASFLVAAALVAMIPGTFRADRGAPADEPRPSFKTELGEGVRWLMGHSLLRPMAIILGLMNLASMVSGATLVLFAQEVLEIGPVLFGVLGFGAALGGIVGGTVAPRASKRFGSGTCLAVVLGGCAAASALIGVLPWWPIVIVSFGLTALLGTLWNVITVSLRQTIIPAHLLGRVNSVYRFFAWGMMPIGAALGGLLVLVVTPFTDREWALRSTWFAEGAIYLGLFVFGRARLTTDRIETARAAGAAATSPAGAS